MLKLAILENIRSNLDQTSPKNFKSQTDFIIINSKWKNSANNSNAYNAFISLDSDHLIVLANIIYQQISKTKLYDWSTIKYDTKIKNTFINEVKNRYSALTHQDQSTTTLLPTNSRKFFISVQRNAGKLISLKPNQKKHNNWEMHEVYENCASIQQAARLKDN